MTEEILKEILKWEKFRGKQKAREVVEREVSHDKEEKDKNRRRVYELTNGDNSKRDIADYTGVSRSAVGSWHRKWAQQGIVEKSGPRQPFEHLVSLKSLGLDRPNELRPEADQDG